MQHRVIDLHLLPLFIDKSMVNMDSFSRSHTVIDLHLLPLFFFFFNTRRFMLRIQLKREFLFRMNTAVCTTEAFIRLFWSSEEYFAIK